MATLDVESGTDEVGTFEEYVRTRSVALQRFAYLVTRNAEDAHDAVQDALIGLYPRWEQVAAAGGVDAYVRRSIVNASISRWRREHRMVPVEDVSGLPGSVVADDADRIAAADAAWRLCADLTPTQRAAIVMRFYLDATFADIGVALECTESSARSHVHRALTKLRTRLAEEGHHD